MGINSKVKNTMVVGSYLWFCFLFFFNAMLELCCAVVDLFSMKQKQEKHIGKEKTVHEYSVKCMIIVLTNANNIEINEYVLVKKMGRKKEKEDVKIEISGQDEQHKHLILAGCTVKKEDSARSRLVFVGIGHWPQVFIPKQQQKVKTSQADECPTLSGLTADLV